MIPSARLVLLALLPALTAATVTPSAQPIHPTRPLPRTGFARVSAAALNPHLHGVPAVAKRPAEAKKAAAAAAGTPSTPVSGTVVGRYNSTVWIALHRGTGTVQGVVHDAKGQPVGGASVRLRDRHGHPLRSIVAKHVTRTGSGGTFLMTRVRAGAYRVYASVHKAHGSAGLKLHSGQVAFSSVKM